MVKMFNILDKCEEDKCVKDKCVKDKCVKDKCEDDKCDKCEDVVCCVVEDRIIEKRIIEKNGIKFRYIGCKGKGKKSKIFKKVDKPRPKGWRWKKDEVYSLIGNVYKCNICEFETKNQKCPSQSIQQHCKNHYELEYSCHICEGEWALKTGKQNHYKYECLSCNREYSGISGCINHSKKCKGVIGN